MISDNDRDYVIEWLIKWVAPVEKPRETLTSAFFGTSFPQDLRQGTPRELVIDAVRLCLVDAWSHNPPWLVLLLNTFNMGAPDVKITEILERVRTPPPPPPDPFNTTILSTNAPFIDRALLRQHLHRLATPAAQAQPILVISGASKCGKTYSANYIDHFSYNKPPIVTHRIELTPELGLDMGAEEVAKELVYQMGRPLNTMPEPNTNQKLYVRLLANWVLNEACQTPSQHWFILDNFRGERLRVEARDLLNALSDLITTGVYSQKCRLILISFDRALLTVDAGRVQEERIHNCSPGDIDVSIREIVGRAPVALAVDRVSPLILSDLPNDESQLEELNMRLRALLHAIPEVKQILADLPGANYEEVLLKMLEELPSGRDRLQELQSRLDELRESAGEL